MTLRRVRSLVALALVLVAAGCGGDEEQAAGRAGDSAPAPTATEVPSTETESEPAGTETAARPEPPETEPPGSPEDLAGGAGDEEPARALALFTGEDGRIVPRVVRVPAFISIRVELRSGDGREYGLSFQGELIGVSGGLGSVSTTFDGLRPGEAMVGRPTGAARNGVTIEATAEPGP